MPSLLTFSVLGLGCVWYWAYDRWHLHIDPCLHFIPAFYTVKCVKQRSYQTDKQTLCVCLSVQQKLTKGTNFFRFGAKLSTLFIRVNHYNSVSLQRTEQNQTTLLHELSCSQGPSFRTRRSVRGPLDAILAPQGALYVIVCWFIPGKALFQISTETQFKREGTVDNSRRG